MRTSLLRPLPTGRSAIANVRKNTDFPPDAGFFSRRIGSEPLSAGWRIVPSCRFTVRSPLPRISRASRAAAVLRRDRSAASSGTAGHAPNRELRVSPHVLCLKPLLSSFISLQYPAGCCVLRNNFLILSGSPERAATYSFSESVSLILTEKIWRFLSKQG